MISKSSSRLIDIFFGLGEGRVYVEEGRFNTVDEGKVKLLDDKGYLIDNQNYIINQLSSQESINHTIIVDANEMIDGNYIEVPTTSLKLSNESFLLVILFRIT